MKEAVVSHQSLVVSESNRLGSMVGPKRQRNSSPSIGFSLQGSGTPNRRDSR
jgi:hypothetical protein